MKTSVQQSSMRQILQAARKRMPFFSGSQARATVRWFMYGIKPGELPPVSGKTIRMVIKRRQDV